MVELLTNTLCPVCGKEMRTIYVPEADINVDICVNGCNGVFFSKKEVWNFDKIQNDIEAVLGQIKHKHFSEIDKNNIRKCPSCGSQMVKFGIDGSDAVMDMCYTCGGRFLDYDELLKLRGNEYNLSTQTVGAAENPISREYYKVLYFSGSLSMRQQFENWVKTHI
jgi:Zn-finger nucleic acid-binding protein